MLTLLNGAKGSPEEHLRLLEAWNLKGDSAWTGPDAGDLYRHVSRRFLKLGKAPLAKEVAQAGIDAARAGNIKADDDPELIQTLGLAHARTGNIAAAQKLLHRRYSAGDDSEETLGILARTYKDQAQLCWHEPHRRDPLLLESLRFYREAFDRHRGYWTGINVATLHALLGNQAQAREVALQVKEQCLAERNRPPSDTSGSPGESYWLLATLGEADLVLGRLEEAEEWYRQAAAANPGGYGDRKSTRRHARWLLERLKERGDVSGDTEARLDEWLPMPIVVVFSGHLIDRPERIRPRFPEELVPQIQAAIRQQLPSGRAVIGYSSAACGGDLLFQQTVQELGGESRIVLPFETEEFRRECVEYAGRNWRDLFDRIVKPAMLVIASDQRHPDDGVGYDYGNRVLHGLAAIRASELESELRGLALWNGEAGDGRGGTADMVRLWTAAGLRVDRVPFPPSWKISLSHVPREGAEVDPGTPSGASPADRPAADSDDSPVQIRSMLFGDAVNYSQLSERQIPLFLKHFLGPIGEILNGHSEENLFRNTWGDGIFLVFRSVRGAGRCALEMAEFVNRGAAGEWERIGLPADMNLRIALHAGPVLAGMDPITGRINYNGAHVSRAARLEPKTPPGEVYASEGFAALCAAEKVADFTCQYVKQLDWAKHYGTFPTYVLHRQNEKTA